VPRVNIVRGMKYGPALTKSDLDERWFSKVKKCGNPSCETPKADFFPKMLIIPTEHQASTLQHAKQQLYIFNIRMPSQIHECAFVIL